MHIFSPVTASLESAEEETKARAGPRSNPGPLAVKPDALPTAQPGPAEDKEAADSAVQTAMTVGNPV